MPAIKPITALRALVEACEKEFCNQTTEAKEPDDSKVSYPEERCHITFGHIRAARKAIIALDSSTITRADVLHVLKQHKLSIPAKTIAKMLGEHVTSRHVATVSRILVDDGLISITYRKGIGFYRYLRSTPKPKESTA